MFSFFKQIKTLYLILFAILSALLVAAFSILYYYKIIDQTLFLILVFISFMAFSTCMSSIFNKIYGKKLNKMGYHPKTYTFDGVNDLRLRLEELTTKTTNEDYGTVYYYIDGIVGYKISLVTDVRAYFDVEGKENINGLPKVDAKDTQNSYFKKCSKLIDLEIFVEASDEYLRKIGIFNYQGDKFYFSSYYTRSNVIIRSDFVKPEGVFDKYNQVILDALNIKEETK